MRCSRAVLAVLLAATFGCGNLSGDGREAARNGGGSPVSWQSLDIGAVGQPGSTSGSFTVSASGNDIWDAADAFRFVYLPLTGDGEIIARIASLGNTDGWAKAGVMIRETLAAGSTFAMSVVTPSNGVDLQFRTTTGGGAGMNPTAAGAAPLWLRLTRSGNRFTGAFSADGASWTSLGSVTIAMAANAYLGLCVTAHDNAAVTTAVIDSVSTIGAGGIPAAVFGNLQPVSFSQVSLSDNFWAPRIERNRTTGLPILYQSFVDNHNLDNFLKAAGLLSGNHDGFLWADSDVYKTLEGMARAIRLHPDADLESKLENVVTSIAAAQISSGSLSGYINTYLQLGNAGRGSGGTTITTQPWENLRSLHEDYLHGHLMEAAIEHHRATGRSNFLTVARKLADHMASVFGDGKRAGVPGHQEAEIALIKLWAYPGGKQSDFDLAKYYIDERGRHSGGRGIFGEYCQDLAPIRTFSEPQGHAVRGPYMWAGATDVAGVTNDAALLASLESIWTGIIEKKMFVTGGTGMRLYNEGYAPDYDLAPDQAYNETCSGCATMMFTHRLANLKMDGKYMDVLERILYNTFAASHSLDVSRMYYNNYMTRSTTKGRMGIACCATNIVRTIPSVGGYQYATKDGDGIWTHLYMAGQASMTLDGATVGIKQETAYPWDGNVKMTLTTGGPATFTLHLRIPAWAAGASATVNGSGVAMNVAQGYLPLSRTWQNNDVVELSLPMAVRRVASHPKVVTHQGRVAIARGPIVYCLESNDNSAPVHKIVIPSGATLSASYDGGLLGGVTKLTGTGQHADNGGPVGFTMIPYGVWDNRSYDTSHMTVMVPETMAAATAPVDTGRVGNATITSSYANPSDTVAAVNDGILPKDNADPTIPRFTWWNHTGTQEWIQYDLPQAITIARSDIHWFEDTGQGGGCDYPETFSHEYWTGASWAPMQLQHDYTNMIDLYGGHFTIVRFTPVTTSKIRLKVTLRPGKSAGILEWRLPE
jgi:uncharacterized protein